jgi:hypothetical protein
MKKIYRCILGRNPEMQGFEYWLKGLDSKSVSKKDVLNSFLHSEEYKAKKFVMFDLNKDPDELYPVDPTINPLDTIEYFTHINNILNLEKLAVRSIFRDGKEEVKNAFSDEDEKKMKERLKALGYI